MGGTKSPHPSCQILPVVASIASSRCASSVARPGPLAENTSLIVDFVNSPGACPVMVSIVRSVMPSGRTKSRTGSAFRAVTSAM